MSSDLTFGRVVAEKRKQLNLSQKELAAKILREDGEPISPQYLSDIERDRRAPTSDHMVGQFAIALSLNADYLHYLNGRFPEAERKGRLKEDEFSERMLAFRRDTRRVIDVTEQQAFHPLQLADDGIEIFDGGITGLDTITRNFR